MIATPVFVKSDTIYKSQAARLHLAEWTGERKDTCVCVSRSFMSHCFETPKDCSPPGSSIHGICQARILEWAVVPFSNGSSQPGDPTQVSHIAGTFFLSEPPGKPKERIWLVANRV